MDVHTFWDCLAVLFVVSKVHMWRPLSNYPSKRCTYRPMYYIYKVVETKYKERYNEALGGMERYVVETKTCYVDVFSYWDFTHVSK